MALAYNHVVSAQPDLNTLVDAVPSPGTLMDTLHSVEMMERQLNHPVQLSHSIRLSP